MANPKIQKPIKKGNNMRNMFTYDFTNRTIVATKATLKKASNPTTDEYTALIKMIEGQPTFRVVEKTIKNSGNKKTYPAFALSGKHGLCVRFRKILDRPLSRFF